MEGGGGSVFEEPYAKDYAAFGSVLGPPICGNYQIL